MFLQGDQFPGEYYGPRYANLLALRNIIRGNHQAVWGKEATVQAIREAEYGKASEVQKILDRLDSEISIVVNLPRVIERKFAGMAIRGLNLTPEKKAEQTTLDAILQASQFKTLSHAAAFRHGTYGNAIMSIRRTKGEVFIDARDPWTWFPEVNPADPTAVLRHVFAWQVVKDEKNYLVQEIHAPNRILRLANRLIDGKLNEPATWDMVFGAYPGTFKEEDAHEVDEPLVAFWRNVTDAETVYGDSDFLGNDSLINEVDNRISQVSVVLDKHADPKMSGPKSAIKVDTKSGRAEVDIKGSKFLERDGKEDAPWEYIVWQSQLESAFSALDRSIDLLCITTEMSPALIGLSDGAGVEATETLRLRAYNTLDAVEAKRVFMSDGLKQMARVALKLAGTSKPSDVRVEFGDPLPSSRKERTEEVRGERSAGLISLERAISRLNPDLTEKEVQAEIELIRTEEAALMNPGQV